MPDQHPPLAGTLTVLVVDDTGAVRLTVFRMLSEAGYRVFEASSAVEALEVLQSARRPLDLLLIDVVMPEVGGVDLARMIRDRWPGIPIIFMSAHPAEVLVREGLEHPEVVFLAKPFTRNELLGKVRAAMHPSAQSREQAARKEQPEG